MYLRQFLDEIPENGTRAPGNDPKSAGCPCEEGRASSSWQGVIRNLAADSRARQAATGMIEVGDLAPALPNLIKPVHALSANGVAIHWRSTYKMHSRPVRTDDKAYSHD